MKNRVLTAGMGLGLLGLLALAPDTLAQGPQVPPYRDFPIVGNRGAVWMAAQLHLMFAAFVLAVPLFVLVIEIMGWRGKQERYDRLAHELTHLLPPAYALTAITGAIMAFFLFTLYPGFMAYLTSIFAPTMWLYPSLFLLESVSLYLYYYLWDSLSGDKKWVHVLIGVMLNLFGTSVMFIANSWASFMMSPGGVSATGELVDLGAAVSNTTWWPLNLHRFVANITFGALLCGAYAAYRYLGARKTEEKAYYDWMGYTGNLIGLFTMLFLPFLGYYLGFEIYRFSPQMGVTLMGGVLSWLFVIQAIVIASLFIGAAYYAWLGISRIPGAETYRRWIPVFNVLLILGFAVWATPHTLAATPEEATGRFHPVLSALGLMAPKMASITVILLILYVSYMFYRRAGKAIPPGGLNSVVWGLILAGGAAIIALGIHGLYAPAEVRIRESILQIFILVVVLISTFILDSLLLRRARVIGAIEWGKVPARSQYVLIALAFIIVWLMGLMGYARSAVRLNWHVSGILQDTSAAAGLPTLGEAANMVTAITLIFFLLLGMVFAFAIWSHRARRAGRIEEY